jgi:hypothetical protein
VAQTPVPAELEPWRDWVLYGEEFRACPAFNGAQPGERGNHVCAWPGALIIDVGSNGAQFEQAWTLFDNAWAELPGDARFWPVGVAVDGVSQAVVSRAGRPAIRLEPGSHTISGTFEWTSRPASIAVPSALGLVSLRLDGIAIANPDLEEGRLWLGLRDGGQREEDTLDISVYRLLSDGLPIRLETVMELDVSGQSREAALPGALPNQFVGENIDSPLPARLEPDGTLRVQLRPGTWTMTLEAHADGLIETISRAESAAPWPPDEVWSYETAPRLRVTSLDGVDGIDAEQAGVPAQWLNFPAYLVGSGQSMTIVERSRNDAAEPNRLSLDRDLWLDFDGSGYTVLDEIVGSMGSGWRLDMAAPYVMTMARSGNDNLLVTTGLEPGLQGIEVRQRSPQIRATARLPAEATLAVSGYAERFDRINATLHLPPAYRLLAAPGADRAFGAWLESWRLLDLFLVLIISAAAWRLFGAGAGVVAFVALVLAFHEPWAPRWAWLNILLAIALARVAPEGRLRTFADRYRLLSLVAVVLLVIPFLVSELRVVMYPQLERALLQRSTQTVISFEQGFGAEPSSAPEESRLDNLAEEIAVTARQLEPESLSARRARADRARSAGLGVESLRAVLGRADRGRSALSLDRALAMAARSLADRECRCRRGFPGHPRRRELSPTAGIDSPRRRRERDPFGRSYVAQSRTRADTERVSVCRASRSAQSPAHGARAVPSAVRRAHERRRVHRRSQLVGRLAHGRTRRRRRAVTVRQPRMAASIGQRGWCRAALALPFSGRTQMAACGARRPRCRAQRRARGCRQLDARFLTDPARDGRLGAGLGQRRDQRGAARVGRLGARAAAGRRSRGCGASGNRIPAIRAGPS